MKKILVISFVFLGINLLQAAPPPPPAGGGDPACWPPPCVPIDGGVVFLLAAGIGLGAKKSISLLKKEKTTA